MSKRAAKKTRSSGGAKASGAARQRVRTGYSGGYYDSVMSTDGIDRYGGLPYDLRVWANQLFHVPQDSVFGGSCDE